MPGRSSMPRCAGMGTSPRAFSVLRDQGSSRIWIRPSGRGHTVSCRFRNRHACSFLKSLSQPGLYLFWREGWCHPCPGPERPWLKSGREMNSTG